MGPWFLMARAARVAGGACFLISLLALTAGCSNKYATKQVEVTGKVTFKGEALPGGRITFASTKKGGITNTANIEEDGTYKIKAPVGDVQIAVDNSMLQTGRRGTPTAKPGLKRPGSEAPHEIKGRWVNIPHKYHTPEDSGLTYKVEDKDPQTHNITLD